MSEWLIHILALGPQTQDTVEELVLRAHERASRAFALAAFRSALPQVAAQEANEASGPYILFPHLHILAHPEWPYFSYEQRSLLRALKAATGGQLGLASSSASAPSADHPRIRSVEEYQASILFQYHGPRKPDYSPVVRE